MNVVQLIATVIVLVLRYLYLRAYVLCNLQHTCVFSISIIRIPHLRAMPSAEKPSILERNSVRTKAWETPLIKDVLSSHGDLTESPFDSNLHLPVFC